MNKNTIDPKIWDDLKSLAEIVTSEIVSDNKLPHYWHSYTRDEILSEVNVSLVELIREYRQGESSLRSYCHRYAKNRTVQRIWREYNKLSHIDLSLDALKNEDGEDANGNVHHKISAVSIATYKSTLSDTDTKELLYLVLSKASRDDRILIKLMLQGNSQDDIADILGISQQAVSKKIKSLSKYSYTWQM